MAKRRSIGKTPPDKRPPMPDPSSIEHLPVTHQQLEAFSKQFEEFNPYALRVETMKRIEKSTGNVVLAYVTQTSFLPEKVPYELFSIVDNDVEGFDSLIDSVLSNTNKRNVDILFVSNGGSAEAAERIVRMLRENFQQIRFILTANAFSAATMMSFACDEILMTDAASLGPIDPQIGGIPARSILRGFEDLDKRLKEEGPEALAAYLDLLRGYSLHLLEMCKSAEALARELSESWLSQYMLKCLPEDRRVQDIVSYFADYDRHKSHSRSIGRKQATEVGLRITRIERGTDLDKLVRSLTTQSALFLQQTDFYKIYENAYGTGWGRRWSTVLQALSVKGDSQDARGT